jgi:hypothetical protein
MTVSVAHGRVRYYRIDQFVPERRIQASQLSTAMSGGSDIHLNLFRINQRRQHRQA